MKNSTRTKVSRILFMFLLLLISSVTMAGILSPDHKTKKEISTKRKAPTSTLEIKLTPNLARLAIGSRVTFRVSIENVTNGPTNSKVTFKLPNGYSNITYVSSVPLVQYDPITGIWGEHIDHRNDDIVRTLDVTATVIDKLNPTDTVTKKYDYTASVYGTADNKTVNTAIYTPKLVKPFSLTDNFLYSSLGTTNDRTEFFLVDRESSNYNHVKIGVPVGGINGTKDFYYNALAFNPTNGYQYMMRANGPAAQRDNIYIMGQDGVPFLYGNLNLRDLPSSDFICGEMDPLGNYYIRPATDHSDIYKINLNTLTYETIDIPNILYGADLAWNNGYLYTVTKAGRLYRINPNDGSTLDLKVIENDLGNTAEGGSSNVFGALYGGKGDHIYGSINDGTGFYRIKLAVDLHGGPRVEHLSTLDASNNNDGAHSPIGTIGFPTDVGIVIPNVPCYRPGEVLTYTVEVTNNGVTNVQGAILDLAQWLDQYPTIPKGNLSYTYVTGVGNTVQINPADPNKPVLTLINKQPANPAIETTFTVSVTIPASIVVPLNVHSSRIILPDDIIDLDGPNRKPNYAEITVSNSVPLDGASISKNVICINEPTPTLTAAGAGTWTSNNPAVATVTSAGIITITGSGEVSFQFTPSLTPNCPPNPVSLKVNPLPLTPQISTTQPTCITSTGTVTVTNPLPNANLRFVLTGADLAAPLSQSTAVFIGLNPGAYGLSTMYVDTECLSTPITFTIVEAINPIAAPTASLTHITCLLTKGTITITTPIAGLTYSLKGPAPASTIIPNVGNTFIDLIAGTYTLTAKDAVTGCEKSANFTINPKTDDPIADAGLPFTKTCTDNLTGKAIGATAVAGLTYSWLPTTGLSNPAIANPIANPMVTTIYTITVTDPLTGCSASKTVEVTVNNTPPVANAGLPFTKTCSTNENGKTIGAAAIDGLTYSWSPTTGLSNPAIANPTANPLVTTTYTLTLTDPLSGCSDSETVVVTVNNTLPIADAGLPFTKSCIANVNGKTIGAAPIAGFTYSWSPTAGLSNAALANPTANPTVTTTYTLTITNTATGCKASNEVLVTVNNTPPVANAGTAFTKTCIDNVGGKEIGTVGEVGLTYSWLPTTGLSNPAIANPIANPGVTTNYTLTVTNPITGCSANSTVAVTVSNTAIVANAGNPFTKTCNLNENGKEIGGAAVAGLTYSWSPSLGLSNATQSNPTANPNITTTYILTVTNPATGCTATDEVLVTVDTTLPVADAGQPFIKTCVLNPSGKQIGALPTAGFSYSWSPSLGLSNAGIANPVANPIVTTTYTLEVTNTETGCKTTATVLVTVNTTVPALPNASITQIPDCITSTGTITVTAPVGGISYTVTGPSPATTLHPSIINNGNYQFILLVSGTYTVTATNPTTGCKSSMDLTIEPNQDAPEKPIGEVTTQPTCLDPTGKITVTNVEPNITYSLIGTNPAVAESIGTVFDNLNPGLYNLIATNAAGCKSSISLEIETPIPPTISATITRQPTCSVRTGVITVDPIETGITYTLVGTLPVVASQIGTLVGNTRIFDNLAPGEYTLTAMDVETGCNSSVDIVIDPVPPSPIANAGTAFTITCDENQTGKVIGAAPVGGLTYSWLPTTGLSNASIANPLATPTTTTIYTLTVTNTLNGCFASSTVEVTVDNTAPIADAGTPFTKTCSDNVSGKEIGIASIPGLNYSWLPVTGLSNPAIANPIANPTSTTNYTLTVTNPLTGCTATSTILVTVNNTFPVANAGSGFTKNCFENINGKEIGAASIAGLNYSWLPTTGLSNSAIANPIADPTSTTNYTLTVTDSVTGCTATSTVLVTVDNTIPIANAGLPFTISCNTNENGKEIGAAPMAGFTYLWSPAAGLSNPELANPIANPTISTTYTLTITNTATGCVATDGVLVTVNKILPIANAGSAFTKTCNDNQNGKEIGTTPDAGLTYSWLPITGLSNAAIANPIANPTSTTTYTLTVTNSTTGCTASSTVLVTVNNATPVANAGLPVTITCNSNENGKEIGATSVAGLTYSWLPVTGLSSATIANPTANPSTTTTYTLTVTNPLTGCTASSTVVVSVENTLPIANAGLPFAKTCNTNENGKEIGAAAIGGLTYSWLPTSGLSNAAIANPIANPTTTTTYTLTVTNTLTGCIANSTVVVTVDNNIPIADAGLPFTKSCNTNENGKEIGIAPVAGLNYSWLPNTGLSNAAIANPIANPTITTTYTLTVTNPTTGCTATSTILVTVDNIIPIANAGLPFTITCNTNENGKQIGTAPIAGLTYSWLPSTGLSNPASANPIANPLVTTTYTLTVSNPTSGCLATSTILVTVDNTIPVATVGLPFTKSCNTNENGKQIGAAPVAGLNYSWLPTTGLSNPAIANPVANPIVTTTYTLTVINPTTGCTTSNDITVTVVPNKIPLLTPESAVCLGNGTYTVKFSSNGTVTAIGGTISGNTVTASIGTNVVLTSTSISGCGTSQATVVSPISCNVECEPPSINGGQAVCEGTGTYAVGINFSPGAIITTSAGKVSGNSIINIPIGTDVTITASNGSCTNSRSIKVTSAKDCNTPCEDAAISYSAGICLGSTYNINFANPKNATIVASAGTLSGNSIINIPIGTMVTLTATVDGGCKAQVLNIPSPSKEIPLLTPESAVCVGNGIYTVKFSSNGKVTAIGGTITGSTVTAAIGTNIVLTAHAISGCGTSEATVISPVSCDTECEPPTLSAGQAVCEGTGTYAVGINFSSGAVITASAGKVSGNSIINIPIGTDVTITANNGSCTNSRSIKVNSAKDCNTPCGDAAISYSAGICLGTTYTINFANPKNATIVASAGTVSGNSIINIPIGTTVTLTATVVGGCGAQVLTIPPPICQVKPAISLLKSGVLADQNKNGYADEGETINYHFIIENIGNVPLTNIKLTDLLPGISITDGKEPFSLNPGESRSDLFTASYKIKQSDIDAGFVVNKATVSGESGDKKVEDESEVKVPLIKDENCKITIYNGVSPNGDGKNDFFEIQGIECYAENNIKIYNRWGVLVFERDHYNNSDRSFKGKSEGRVTLNANEMLPTGVYFYILKYKDSKSVTHSKSGHLYLSL